MANKAYKILEFDKILSIMAGYTTNEPVKERILKLQASSDLASAVAAQRQTSEAARMLLKFGYPPNLSAPQVLGALRRCTIGGILSARELLDIARVLNMARSIKRYLANAAEEDFPILRGIDAALTVVRPLEEQISMCILSEEEIADGASAELSAIRRKMRNLQGKIKDMLDAIIRSGKYQKYLQEPIVTMRSDRYVIPVRAEYRSELPGVVHDTSSSGATLFVEPMSVVNANNEIRDLTGKEQAEIERILAALSAEVSAHTAEIESNYIQLCELDFIFCKGKLSESYGCSEPVLNDTGSIHLKKARHPLIAAKDVVANDIYLGDTFDTLVITGPNTGGKTVTLKTIGLFCLMAAAGLHIPANDGSSVSVFHKIWADIGDEQSIEQSLSTFSSHMKNIVNIVRHVDEKALVLFDELGAGTDPIEGAALAVSILEYLRLVGAKSAATTHYSELKLFALSTPGVCNASCEFDVRTLRPTYRLLIGVPGKSNAFAISEQLGLDASIIERARSLMSEDNIRFEDLISSLEQNRQQAEAEAAQAEAYRQEVAQLKQQVEAQKERLESKRQKILDEARREAKRIIMDAKEESTAVIKELTALRKTAQNQDTDRSIEQMRSRLRSKENELDTSFSNVLHPKKQASAPKSVKPGDLVEVVTIGQQAEVLKAPDASGNLFVQAGMLKLNVNLRDLRLLSKKEAASKKQTYTEKSSTYTPKKANAKTEIDLRGYTLEEALLEADQFISDAYMAGLSQVSIIHGKGTGVLRAGIGDMLKRHSLVKSYRLGKYGEGETGVTIVELK